MDYELYEDLIGTLGQLLEESILPDHVDDQIADLYNRLVELYRKEN